MDPVFEPTSFFGNWPPRPVNVPGGDVSAQLLGSVVGGLIATFGEGREGAASPSCGGMRMELGASSFLA